MFFADQAEAFGNLARALRRGGRLVLMSWRSLLENEWIRSFAQALAPPDAASGPPPEGPGPFAHAQPERTRAILEEAGFADITMEPVDEPMYFGRDADEGHVLLSTSLAWMAGDVDDDTRRSAFARLADSLRPRDGRGCGLRLGCLARDRQQARLVPDPESVHPSLDGAGGQPLSVGAGGEPTRPQSRVDPPTRSGRPAHKIGPSRPQDRAEPPTKSADSQS